MNKVSEKPIKEGKESAGCAAVPCGRPAGLSREKAICYLEAGGGWGLGVKKMQQESEAEAEFACETGCFPSTLQFMCLVFAFVIRKQTYMDRRSLSEGVTGEGLDGEGGRGREREGK